MILDNRCWILDVTLGYGSGGVMRYKHWGLGIHTMEGTYWFYDLLHHTI